MTVGCRLITAGLDGFELPTLSMWFVGDDLGRPLLKIVDRVAGRAVGNANIVIGRDPEPATKLWASLCGRCLGEVVVEVDVFWDAGAAVVDAWYRDRDELGLLVKGLGAAAAAPPAYPNSGPKYRRMLAAPTSPTGPNQHM